MNFDNLLSLVAGLTLFLYGMHMMSEGLELAAGNKMQMILEKLTSNRFIGVAVGALITALIQSSSATTVMVVGFVNTGLMNLNQAVWIIMGANIGTTITGQLIALDVGRLAPFFALIGVVLVVFIKNKKTNYWGQILAGLGILFIGMDMMSGAMAPLRMDPTFIRLMTTLNNPITAILVGAVFTAIIQSSSASVGILQTLANNGLIGLQSSAYILFGQNIGTCITAFLASLSANRNAKRTTIIHLSFNIIGTFIFVIACSIFPIVTWVQNFTNGTPAAEIANFHTLFNVVTTLLLLPIGTYLAKLSTIILPIDEEEKTDEKRLLFISQTAMGSTYTTISSVRLETRRLFEKVGRNINLSLKLLDNYSEKTYKKILKQEDYINYLAKEITHFVGRTTPEILQVSDSELINSLFNIATKLERMGNHAVNIARSSNEMNASKGNFVIEKEEILKLEELLTECLNFFDNEDVSENQEAYDYIKNAEVTLDSLTKEYRDNQMKRLQKKKCSIESCVLYSRVLIDAERVSDYLAEIANLCKEYKVSFVNPQELQHI